MAGPNEVKSPQTLGNTIEAPQLAPEAREAQAPGPEYADATAREGVDAANEAERKYVFAVVDSVLDAEGGIDTLVDMTKKLYEMGDRDVAITAVFDALVMIYDQGGERAQAAGEALNQITPLQVQTVADSIKIDEKKLFDEVFALTEKGENQAIFDIYNQFLSKGNEEGMMKVINLLTALGSRPDQRGENALTALSRLAYFSKDPETKTNANKAIEDAKGERSKYA